MSFWEETGRRHGLKTGSGFLLGGETPGIADVVTATLWSTVADRFPVIDAALKDTAPMITALSARITALPSLAALAKRSKAEYGEVWSGGEIEASLRKVFDA